MNFLIAQAPATPPLNFWNGDNATAGLWIKIIIGLVLGFALMIGLLFAPTRMRRPIVVTFTFLAGLFWMVQWLWPRAGEGVTEPTNATEGVALWLKDALPVVTDFANILTAFLLGLGIYSLVSIHGKRLIKKQTDWVFSGILLLSIVIMMIFGYADWLTRLGEGAAKVELVPGFWNRGRDLLFDGMLQQMDAAMFSLIAFFILSAAYRAFRIRSIESTILLSTALIVMISIMGAIVFMLDSAAAPVSNNLKLSEIAGWITGSLQTPAIRAINFGVGVGALAMGIRLWLSLDRGGVSG
ncbi:MAG TPA: hypothetical protein PLH94_11180 [Fimbriimonadaceae bacterium]|nr:hypothetical protein [Fimbriimonadaceae bacterium]